MKSMQKVNKKKNKMRVLKNLLNYAVAITAILFITGIDSIVELIFTQF